MSTKNCASCTNIIKGREYLKCHNCHSSYDIICANVTEKRFKAMNADNRINWSCFGCRSKENKSENALKRTNRPTSPVKLQRSPTPPNISTVNIQQEIDSLGEESEDVTISITKRDLWNIVKQEIESAIKELVPEQFNKINAIITSLQQSLSFFNEQYEEMKSTLTENSTIIKSLEKENITLQAKLKEVTKRTNLLEQHARSNNIEVQCVPEYKSENLISTMLQLSNVIKCDIKDDDIHFCSRIAKKDTKSTRPRSIVVKFSTPRIRDNFLAATMKFNRINSKNKLNTSHLGIGGDTPQPIFVVEHLSAENKAIHAAARTRAKELGYKFVWVRNGRILMKKSESSETLVVGSTEKLKSLT